MIKTKIVLGNSAYLYFFGVFYDSKYIIFAVFLSFSNIGHSCCPVMYLLYMRLLCISSSLSVSVFAVPLKMNCGSRLLAFAILSNA